MRITSTRPGLAAALLGALLLPATAAVAAETNHWSFDLSLYGLAAGMSGDVAIGPVKSDVDVGFDKVVEHLKFGAMGTARVGYDRWALTTDVVYMHLGESKGSASADLEQWLVEPTLSYTVCKYFEPLAGMRYNNISGDITGRSSGGPPAGGTPPTGTPTGEIEAPVGMNYNTTSVAPSGSTVRARTGTQDWYDPIIGANVALPISQSFSFRVRGDIGGFGVGSDFTWQAFPYFDWRFAKLASLQLGYRFLYTDYESGSGLSKFKYDMLTSGPQIGFTFHF